MDSRKKAIQFARFISGLRDKRNVTMEQLCEGLCSRRMAWYLESGERAPDKLLQDRILERLGVGAEDYECFLFHDEYDRWAARQSILHNITYEKWEGAEHLLQEYCDTHDMSNALEKQFYLGMLAQIRRYSGEACETLRGLFEEAARLTVPELENKPLAQMALCVKELNPILEAEHCRKEGERPQRYQEIADYILAGSFDGISVAKLYPKAIYFLCRSIEQGADLQYRRRWTDNRLLAYCGQALGFLRDCFGMYYLWEILDMREKLLGRVIQNLTLQQETPKAANLAPMRQENALWKQVLERTYAEFHVPRETFEYCYLYVVKEVSCINDVIRIRRKMFGMSQKELCRDICDTATLRRLERRETVPHREIAEKLFERLGLSAEFTRTNLVTASHEAKLLMGKLRKQSNAGKWNETRVTQEQIKSLIDMEIPHNRRTLMRLEKLSNWHSGEISREEYLARMREALELTLPYQIFCKEGEQYLTNEEQLCIQNMMDGMAQKSDEYVDCAHRFENMYQSYETNELLENVFSMYEVIMGNIGSWRGNIGDIDRSDQYNIEILKGCLRFRRSSMVNRSLYGKWWNYNMRKSQGIPTTETLDDTEELMRCILFSRLNKQKNREQFLQKKLQDLKEKK